MSAFAWTLGASAQANAQSIIFTPALAWTLGDGAQDTAPSDRSFVDLVVNAGRPLRVALDGRVRVKHVGQPVTGTLVEPVYAYDRMVVPAGIRVLGHVAKLERVSGGARVRGILSLDFSPPRQAILEFDSLILDDGSAIPIRTEVRSAVERLALQARDTPRKGVAARAGEEITGKAKQAVSAIKEPGKLQRLKYALIGALPFHPQYLHPGTVYTAALVSPLDFGVAEATEPAPARTAPPPDSILHARLLTALNSAKTPKGSPVQAVVTQPLFSEDQRLILPEGAILAGEVTFAKAAGHFRRNGQLRFLFETVQEPEQGRETLRASLYSVQVGRGERLALDDEGGATITNSKARFAAPALAGLALGVSLHRRLDYDTDGLGPEGQYSGLQSHSLGGFFGLGFAGAALSQLSRPVAIGLGILGVARTVFVSLVGKGRDVSFPADTVMEVQLGAQPEPRK